jgi:decarbamoylnovobiocin carbamoyltransferase/7-O-carbamoyltransferase
MLVLGVSGGFAGQDVGFAPDVIESYYHDAAACLIRDGELVMAVEEERFNRVKKTTQFPVNAIRACVDAAGVPPAEIDAIGYFVTERSTDIMMKLFATAETEVPIRPSRELLTERLRDSLGIEVPGDRLLYIPHHLNHAMSGFVRSGMDDALVVVMDGWGDEQAISIYRGSSGRFSGQRSQLETLAVHDAGKSLGKYYLDKIGLLGYGLGDEYKVMGLAPYGNPETYRALFDAAHTLKDGGDFDLDFGNWQFVLQGFMPRRKGQDFTAQHIDLAAGLQHTLERIVMHVLGYWAQRTGLASLCFVGGVAQNSSLNGLILRSGTFGRVFIHPAAHDGGTAEGAALAAALQLGAPPFRQPQLRCASTGPGLGTAAEIEKELAGWAELIDYERPAGIVDSTAALLAGGAVLGWAHGRSEYGPRALGNRSILADARPAQNKERINSMVKKREAYRPFAPVVTARAAPDYFDLPPTAANYDFMSFVVAVRPDKRAELGAVTHIDGTARVQVLDAGSNPRFHQLLTRFGELTGVPVLLNTSFNNNAEPIVQTVHDAVTCFLTTGLDYLVIEDFLIRRRPGPLALDALVPQFRPHTRLGRLVRMTPAGQRQIIHTIYLQHLNGPDAEITPQASALLEAADGIRTLESLADTTGGLTDDIRRELHSLWQSRYFSLRPAQ